MNFDGDIFDPNGTLTGGYVNPNESILLKNEEFKRINNQIEEMRKEQRVFEEKIAKLKKDQEYLSNLKGELEAKTLKLNLLKEKMKRNSNAKMQDKHVSFENDLVVYAEQIKRLLEIEKQYLQEIEELKTEKTGFLNNSSRDSKEIWREKIKKFEGEIKKLNEEVAFLKKSIYKSEVEREGIEGDLKRLDVDLVKGEKGYEELKENYTRRKEMLGVIRKEFENLMVISFNFFYFSIFS